MATFSLSPSIEVKEIDQTTFIPGAATSIGAFSGAFSWGPVHEVVNVASVGQLISRFSKPTDQNYEHFFSASSFLDYSNNLNIVRCKQTGMLNANSGGDSDVLIYNSNVYSTSTSFGGSPGATGFAAKYPGQIGNSLKVAYCLACTPEQFESWDYSEYFDSAPGTSEYADDRNSSNDEIHLIIIDEDGQFTGTPNTVLERFAFLSLASDAVDDIGGGLYIKTVLEEQSQYVYLMDNDALLEIANAGSRSDLTPVFFDTNTSPAHDYSESYSLTAGADGALPTRGEREDGFAFFKDTENITINLLIGGPSPIDTLENATSFCDYLTKTIAETRHDCVAFVSPPLGGEYASVNQTDIDNVVAFLDGLDSTSFGFADTNPLKIYDRYNNAYRWIPASGSMAGLCAYTDEVADAWWSPAGLNRGILKNVIQVGYNPNKTDRDNLYRKRGNPIVEFPGQGVVLYGDKTLLSRPSAFSRINVRRLFNVLEKSISEASRYVLFDFNDEFKRSQFISMVEPFLRTVKGRRGIYEYRIVCDETNNTPEVIDRDEFVADIFIAPARSINFVRLNFIGSKTDGIVFREVGE